MDELGRALQGLAAEACAGVTSAEPKTLLRRRRRRAATHLAGGLAVGMLAVALGGQIVTHQVQSGLGERGSAQQPSAGQATPAPGGDDRPAVDIWTGPDAGVFLSQGVMEAQRRAILTRIQAVDAVDSVAYESKAEAYARFREQFSDQPDLTENVTEEALPESYRVMLRTPLRYSELETALCPGEPGGSTPSEPEAGQEREGESRAGCMPGIDIVIDFTGQLGRTLAGPSWTGRADVAVILEVDVTTEQRAEIIRRLDATDLVTSVEHETSSQAHDRIEREQRDAMRSAPDGDQPDPDALAWLQSAKVPESFRVRLVSPDNYGEFFERFCDTPRTHHCAPGVLFVVEQRRISAQR